MKTVKEDSIQTQIADRKSVYHIATDVHPKLMNLLINIFCMFYNGTSFIFIFVIQ